MEVTCKAPDGTTLFREVACQIPDTTSVLDWITALASAAAVLIAAIAVVMTQRSITRERRHQRLVGRHRAAIELLEAFETDREHGSHDVLIADVLWESPPEARTASARFDALLRASEEPLPLNRWYTYARHDPDAEDRGDLIIDHMIATGQLAEGHDDGLNTATRAAVLRHELIDSIDDLRDQINKS